MIPANQPPTDAATRAAIVKEALFGPGEARYQFSPTTDGYPDIDTFRDLEFHFQVSWSKPVGMP